MQYFNARWKTFHLAVVVISQSEVVLWGELSSNMALGKVGTNIIMLIILEMLGCIIVRTVEGVALLAN